MLCRIALTALVFLATARAAIAAEGSEPPVVATTAPSASAPGEQMPTGRVLNGHVFMPSVSVPGALTTTSFGTYLILGYGTTSGSIQVGDKVFAGTYSYAGVGATLGYEYAFLRYFSARLAINEIVYSGIDGKSAIAVGTTAGAGGSLGLTASMPVGDSLRVGALLDAGIAPGLAMTIGNGIRDVIETCNQGNCTVNDQGFFGMKNATTVQPALAANWAPWRPLGVTANLAYLFVSQKRGGENFNGQAVSLAAAADFDFRAVSSVPIGLQVAAAWTAPVGGKGGIQHVGDLGGGIFYTGQEHLALGLQVISRQFAVQPDLNVSWSTYISTIGLRYYW
jgi:hypothetical protein